MQYWNKAMFDGLADLADALDANTDLQGVAEYCRNREQGLRSRAFDALRIWMNHSTGWPEERQRAAAIEILQASARFPDAHTLLSHPLREDFLLPVLREWYKRDPSALHAVRWLGILEADGDLLREALRLDPNDVPVRRKLIDFALGAIWYQTHHLGEGRFIGELSDALDAVALAKRLLMEAPESDSFSDLWTELRYYDDLLTDWRTYNRNPLGSFAEWCRARDKAYNWPATYYYSPRGAS